MGFLLGSGRFSRYCRVAAAMLGALTLANCSAKLGSVDPKYGVSSSARVIEPGQPVPKGGGVYRVGKPYVIAGRTYTPEEDVNYSAEGMASWYGDDFHGRYTANGEIFDMNSISAAHPTLPMPSYVRVTNLRNKKSIVVRVNDRGPYANDRIIDLSVRTAKLLDFYGHGLARVKVEYIGRAPLAGSDDRKLMATLRDGTHPAPEHKKIEVASADDYAPTYFDSRPMGGTSLKQVPQPAQRPYTLGDSAQTAQLSANQRVASAHPPAPRAVERATLDLPPAMASQPAPQRLGPAVSAYAPVRYDAQAGFLSGRGLY